MSMANPSCAVKQLVSDQARTSLDTDLPAVQLHWKNMKGLQHGSSPSSATPTAATPSFAPFHPLADKWDRYYAGPPGTAPFDSTRPSSQLVDYLCCCIHDRVCSNKRPLDTKALVDVASKAPMCLPSQLEEGSQQELHSCQRCCAYKPSAGRSRQQ